MNKFESEEPKDVNQSYILDGNADTTPDVSMYKHNKLDNWGDENPTAVNQSYIMPDTDRTVS